MSMKSWTEEGFGFNLFTEGNMDKVKDFLVDNIETVKKVQHLTELSEDEIRACEDEIEMNDILFEPVSRVVANVINELEGMSVFAGYDSCGDTDQDMMIGIIPAYPWGLKESDMITKEKAEELLNKYAEALGIDEEPDYFEAEYFG